MTKLFLNDFLPPYSVVRDGCIFVRSSAVGLVDLIGPALVEESGDSSSFDATAYLLWLVAFGFVLFFPYVCQTRWLLLKAENGLPAFNVFGVTRSLSAVLLESADFPTI